MLVWCDGDALRLSALYCYLADLTALQGRFRTPRQFPGVNGRGNRWVSGVGGSWDDRKLMDCYNCHTVASTSCNVVDCPFPWPQMSGLSPFTDGKLADGCNLSPVSAVRTQKSRVAPKQCGPCPWTSCLPGHNHSPRRGQHSGKGALHRGGPCPQPFPVLR